MATGRDDIADESNVFKALSVTVRRQILDLIARRGPIDLKSLLDDTGLTVKEPTVRHHVLALERAGFINITEDHQGSRGRPRLLLSITDTHWPIGFPPRQYSVLAEHLLGHIIATQGKKKAMRVMRKIGLDFGRQMVAAAQEQAASDELSFDDVADHILPVLDELGSMIDYEEEDDTLTVHYRNCIFYEVAKASYPIVCEGHHAILDAIGDAMDCDAEPLSCLVKGDPACSTCFRRRT